jgi:hypothetical protein
VSVDDDLLPNEIHVAHSARSVSQADPSTDTWDLQTVRALVGTHQDATSGIIAPWLRNETRRESWS